MRAAAESIEGVKCLHLRAPFKNCLPERGPSDVRREGESKDPGAASLAMTIQGVLLMLSRANALMLYLWRLHSRDASASRD